MAKTDITHNRKKSLFPGIRQFLNKMGKIFLWQKRKGEITTELKINEENIHKSEQEKAIKKNNTQEENIYEIINSLTSIKAKRMLVNFIKKTESKQLRKQEILLLDDMLNRFTQILPKRKKNIILTVQKANIQRIMVFIDELKHDSKTLLDIKKEIIKEILKKLKKNVTEEKQKISGIINNYTRYLKKLEWEKNSLIRLVSFILKALTKESETSDRLKRLSELVPFAEDRIKDRHLKDISNNIFKHLISFYQLLNQNKSDHKEIQLIDININNLPDSGQKQEASLNNIDFTADSKDFNSTNFKSSSGKGSHVAHLQEIKEVEKEIEAIPTLKEKITSLYFWLKNDYYKDKPHINNFLENTLLALEKVRAREGGLVRYIFDQLKLYNTIDEKLNFLKEKLNDEEYHHLRSTINTLINNIQNNYDLAPVSISEEWISEKLKNIHDPHMRLDWLTIRKYLSSYLKYNEYIDYQIDITEKLLEEKLTAKLEENLYKKTLSLKDSNDQKLYKNIISLTRNVLKLTDKVSRRLFIKEQEQLLPLSEEELFYKQRKLLYYMLNTDNDENHAIRLKVLADKILLTLDEKKEFFRILKLSKFKMNDSVVSLQSELGITDEDLAYYAVYILGLSRPTLENKIKYVENIHKDIVSIPDITYTDNNGESNTINYKQFFKITSEIINKLLKEYRKRIKLKTEKTEISEDIQTTQNFNSPNNIEGGMDRIDNAIESSIEREELSSETSGKNDHVQVKKAIGILDENKEISPEEEKKPIKKPIINKNIKENDFYLNNKTSIDVAVKKRLKAKGEEKTSSLSSEVKKETESNFQESKSTLSEKLEKLFDQLSRCFVEAVPNLIDITIIPIFVENQNTTIQDILNSINQNIFIPVLYDGADIDINKTLESIEVFLAKKDLLKKCYKHIQHIADNMKKVRSDEIRIEIKDKQRNKEIIPENKINNDIKSIISCLISLDKSKDVYIYLQENYINKIVGNPDKKMLLNKLVVLRNLLGSRKKINWEKVEDFFCAEVTGLIKNLMDKILSTNNQTDSNNQIIPEDKKSISIPAKIEKAFMDCSTFSNPQTIIKECMDKNNKLKDKLGGSHNIEINQIITSLFNSGKIFSFDRKRYIGFGKIGAFIKDKNNVGYNKQELARSLLLFLKKFQTNEMKTNFLGINENELQDFYNIIENWSKNIGTQGTASNKRNRSALKKLSRKQTDFSKENDRRKEQRRKGERRNKITILNPSEERRKNDRRSGRDRRIYNEETRSTKNNKIPALSAKSSKILDSANKIITEKLIFFIKQYNHLEPLYMLYKYYINPNAKSEELLSMIDKNRHKAIYIAVKNDPSVLNRLSYDKKKILKLYNKKQKKLKK